VSVARRTRALPARTHTAIMGRHGVSAGRARGDHSRGRRSSRKAARPKPSQSLVSSEFLTQKELDPDFVDFNSVNRRYHFPARTYVPFRSLFSTEDPLIRVSNQLVPMGVLPYSIYSLRHPTHLVDPLGLQEQAPEERYLALQRALKAAQEEMARMKRAMEAGLAAAPVDFKGFSGDRYQELDRVISKIVWEFNLNKTRFCGCNDAQAGKIPDLTGAIVKSWLIQESGGGDPRSQAAWKKDPGQVNVPGDWSPAKEALGLTEPTARNEGTLESNVRAAVMWLCRKGFGKSGAAPKPAGFFDGWEVALQRYNGRTVVTENDKEYRVNYAQRIMERTKDPKTATPIELPKPK